MKIVAVLLVASVIGVALGGDYPPIFGLDSGVGRTYDIVSERMYGPAINYHYDGQQQFYSPFDQKIYLYPDEMYVTVLDKGSVDSQVNDYMYYSEYIKDKTSKMDISVGYTWNNITVAGTFQRTKHSIEQGLMNNTRHFATQEHRFSFYSLSVYPDSPLSIRLQKSIGALPVTIATASDSQLYMDFIARTGTHVITQAVMGGMMNFTVFWDNALSEKHSQEWITNQVALSLQIQHQKIGEMTWSANSTSNNTDIDFKPVSQTHQNCVGGSIALCDNSEPKTVDPTSYNEWKSSLFQTPGLLLFQSQLLPLYSFVDAKLPQRQLLRVMTEQYLAEQTAAVAKGM
eukprot:Colp12_sorted_trinity150504_noHs@258